MNSIFKPAIVLFFSIFSLLATGQTFDVSWGDNAKLKYDFDDAVPLPGGQSIILKIKAGTRFSRALTPILMLVDANMETIKENEIEIDESGAVIRGFEKYGNNIFFMYNAYDRSAKTTSVYALKIDPKSLNTVSKITLATYESDGRYDQAKANYKLSADSSKLLLFAEGPAKKDENAKIFVAVFDTDLKKIWSRDLELPMADRYVSIYDQDITDDGKIFVAVKHYEKEVSREMVREDGDKIPSYIYKLFVYAKESEKAKEITFDLNNQFIQGTKLIYNKNGSIIVAGLYKRKHNGNINGAFYSSFDGSANEIKKATMVDFSPEFISLIDKDHFGNDKEKDPGLYPGFRINQILTRSNGSVDLISEYYKLMVNTRYDPSSRTYSTTYNYIYGDIVNTNIDKNGKAVFTRIPKNQKFSNSDVFLGYFPFIYKDKLVLLFNDDKDNVDRDLSKAPDDVMKFKKSVFVAATIDAKGNLSRQAIFSNDDEDYITMPRNTARISENSFLISSDLLKFFKRRTRFGVLNVK